MKKIILFTLFLFTTIGFSQPISVSTTAYSVPQLVNNVLINSPCVSATNITWSTGSDFGSSNGIGYFKNTNTNFPMQSGVVLSTGKAVNAAGPNDFVLNDGSPASWPGDSSLEATLAAEGITMVSTNATTLEFDFMPISSKFSFDFVFASEEYGNYQCQYGDAFIFLLTDMTTNVTTNLAVVPNTNTPISVLTIRDFQYNSSCPSSNAQYFGSFNGGSGAANSATNFNGQTIVLTAASSLTPGVPYHIKLVIADRADPESDSAIFISSENFNIGQNVLGQDMTIANNTALCFGTSHTLDTGLSTINYTFEWKKNNNVISGENGPTLSVNTPGEYSVTYTNIFSSCAPFTDFFILEYYPEIIAKKPNNIYKCNIGASSYTFDLSSNTGVVKKGLDPLTVVTYHISQNDADSNSNPLPLQFNSAGGQTIYVRIQLPNSVCYTVKTFELQLTAPPLAYKPDDMIKCSKSGGDAAPFNINSQTPIIMGSQSSTIFSVSYYNSSNDANNALNQLTNLSNGVHKTQTVYVRIQNDDDPTCYSITSFEIIVNAGPPVDNPENVFTCVEYILPALTNGEYYTETNGGGTQLSAGDSITETMTVYIFNQLPGANTCASNESFKVTIMDSGGFGPQDVSACGRYILPKLPVGKYYTAPGKTGTVIPAGTKITTSQTLYYYYKSTIPPYCEADTSFNISISPGIDIGERADVFECNSYTLPVLSVGKYYTGPNKTGRLLNAGTVITTSQTIYVHATSTGPNPCQDEDNFEVFIGMEQPENISQCNGYTLPELAIGNYYTGPMGSGQQIPAGTVINESTTIYIYAPTTSGASNCTDNMFFTLSIAQPKIDIFTDINVCETRTLPTITYGEYFTGPEGSGTKLYSGDVILSTQTIYTFARLDATCYNQSSFKITVNPLPAIDSRSDIDICHQYVLTALNLGNYYTGPNGTGNKLPAGTVITSTQKIYIFASSNTTPPCTAENSFEINIFTSKADAPQNVVACDNYTLPVLILPNKYYTKSGGPNGGGTEVAPGTVITTSQTLYVFKESVIRTAFTCIDENSFTITINNTPTIAAISDIEACKSYTLPVLSIGNYYTKPNASGTMLYAGDILTSSQTVYAYAHSSTTPDCISEISFAVTIFKVDNSPNITICENYTLPALTVGKYYTGPNGTGTILPAGSVIKSSQDIYIFGLSPFTTSCSDENKFTITIVDTPVAYPVSSSLTTVCDEDGKNDGVTSFDLTNLSITILNSQTGSEFNIRYYESMENAVNQNNAVTSTKSPIVFARVSNTLTSNCYDIKPVTIIVNKLPEPKTADGIICIDSATGLLLNPYTINTGLSTATHAFVWTNENNKVIGFGSSYKAVLPGKYTLIATSKTTGCASEPTIVTVSPSGAAIVDYEVNEYFADSQSVTVTATGPGNNFEYQMDNGPFQDSNVFENVISGMHLITVRDKNGCGDTTTQVIVVNYPKYFTPNGDGYHDTWNIKNLSDQPNAQVTIYDRFGKTIKHIRPKDDGWDGTFNGDIMPSDDYWFSISYVDNKNINQEFKAHFSLKR